MYGRLINGRLEYAPINYKLVDNRTDYYIKCGSE